MRLASGAIIGQAEERSVRGGLAERAVAQHPSVRSILLRTTDVEVYAALDRRSLRAGDDDVAPRLRLEPLRLLRTEAAISLKVVLAAANDELRPAVVHVLEQPIRLADF